MGAVRTWGELSTRPDLDFASADSAMGHAADLALGMALAVPDRKVICLNGDGSLLMNLGTLVTIAELAPRNLILIVLQNNVYEITGGQLIAGHRVTKFSELARAAGISQSYFWRSPEAVRQDVKEIWHAAGPIFACARIDPGNDGPIRRGRGVPEPYLRASLAEAAHQLRVTITGG